MKARCLMLVVLAFAYMSVVGSPAQAAAAQKAICAVEQTVVCEPFKSCERVLPGAVNLPVLLKIDRSAGVILSRRESGEERSSKIGAEAGDDDFHVLQGIDAGSPWNIRVDLKSGRFVLTSAQPDAGFVAFGLCSSTLLN